MSYLDEPDFSPSFTRQRGHKQPTNADRIRTLYAAGKCVAEIAAIIGCSTSYVRVCARQRTGGHSSRSDTNYEARVMAIVRNHPRCIEAARAAYRTASAQERAAGRSRKDASAAAIRAYYKTRRGMALTILKEESPNA